MTMHWHKWLHIEVRIVPINIWPFDLPIRVRLLNCLNVWQASIGVTINTRCFLTNLIDNEIILSRCRKDSNWLFILFLKSFWCKVKHERIEIEKNNFCDTIFVLSIMWNNITARQLSSWNQAKNEKLIPDENLYYHVGLVKKTSIVNLIMLPNESCWTISVTKTMKVHSAIHISSPMHCLINYVF